MSWEPAPACRWVKMYRGVRYRVSCSDLHLPPSQCNKEDSYLHANNWWIRKRAEIDGEELRYANTVLDADGVLTTPKLDALRELQAQIDFAQFFRPEELPALNAVKERLDAHKPHDIDAPLPHPDDEIVAKNLEAFTTIFGVELPADADRTAIKAFFGRSAMWADRLKYSPAKSAGKATIGTLAEKWLTLKASSVKPGTHRELPQFVREWLTAIHPDAEPKTIDEAAVGKVYQFTKDLKISPIGKFKRWARFKEFVSWLWSENFVELPRNLKARYFKFPKGTKAVKTYDLAEVQKVVDGLPERTRLYALLGLNCGMTNIDMAFLRHDMVDWKAGTLTRKRVKTEGHKDVPTVTYKLWPTTLVLLKKWRSNHPELVLLTKTGTPLYTERFKGGKAIIGDLIGKQWRRQKVSIPLKAFRSIGATVIESHENYGRYKEFFLGHSPKSLASKHYAPPSIELFAKILDWLHGQIWAKAKKLKTAKS